MIIKFKNLTEIDKEVFSKSYLTLLDASNNNITVKKKKNKALTTSTHKNNNINKFTFL